MKFWRSLLMMTGIVCAIAWFMNMKVPNAAAAGQFTDLQNAGWAEDGINYLADRGTVAGYGGGAFKPLHSITRAQAVTYLVRELYPEAAPLRSISYGDVPRSHMFYREILIAAEMGLAGGYPDGSFRPDAPITRGETAAMLSRAYHLTAGNAQTVWRDAQHHWAAEAISLLSSNGLAGGYLDGTFKPERNVNRAEYAVFLSRIIHFKRQQAIAAQDWDGLLSLMTLEEKAGQMLMPDIRMWQGKPTTQLHEGLKSLIQDHRLGGLILFEKNITDIRQLTSLNHQLQSIAGDIPLFLGIDQEGGVVKRLPGGTNLPGAMALGASGSSELSFEAGRVTGAELKALGINLNFAPVLDVNVNPDNPIIGIRSFGSDPALVSELGTAFMRGLKHEGVIAAVKHFPGHGDTAVDSHLGLPVVQHGRQRLDEVEMRPFREAIDQGVGMIMTAHVSFPAIEGTKVRSMKDGSYVSLPATLSRNVLTGLLRDEMGYKGVVISDAFTMEAIAEHFGEAEAVVQAISAGVDIILMPLNITDAFESIKRAVNSGKLEEQQLDISVKRILKLKHSYGLFVEPKPLEAKLRDVQQIVGSAEHREVERQIAEEAVTWMADDGSSLPYQMNDGSTIAIIAPNASVAERIIAGLKELDLNHRVSVNTIIQGEDSREAAAEAAADADFVIAASYQFRSPGNQYDWQGQQILIDNLNARSKRYVLLSLGNPYELMYLRDVKAGLAVYGAQQPNITAGLKVMFGLSAAKGTLPVTLKSR